MGSRSPDAASKHFLSSFLVGAPLRAPLMPRPAASQHAVLVVHGMGQQTKFETLDLLVRGLVRAAGEPLVGKPRARLVELAGERLHRVELTLKTDGAERELHLYEGYWAPRTEGQVTLRDVVYLLFVAIGNGVTNGATAFRRWLFGDQREFPPQIRAVIYLLVGLLAVLALVVINAVIGVVAVTRWGLGVRPIVVNDGLYGDISTTLNLLFVVLALFAILLGVNRLSRQAPSLFRFIAAGASVIGFSVALVVTIGTGVAIPLLFYLHRQPEPIGHRPLLPAAVGLRLVEHFNALVELVVVALILAGVLVGALAFFGRLLTAWWQARRAPDGRQFRTTLVIVLFAALVTGLAVEVTGLAFSDWGGTGGGEALGRGVVWALLVAASLIVRRVIVQYVGDVVAYVEPHTLDRFQTLRDEIKTAVYKRARAIYGAESDGAFNYASVAIVGHSLGSVIAYDTLNRLINDDGLVPDGSDTFLDVVNRTSLFLTFGSPLDKTAFLFGAQREQTPTRYALSATVQPLIQRPEYRPRWVNIYSPWDPISARLDYYDPPHLAEGIRHPKAVDNRPDPDATTLFLAHIEYWQSALLFDTLLDELSLVMGRAERGFDETSCPHDGRPAARGTTGLEAI